MTHGSPIPGRSRSSSAAIHRSIRLVEDEVLRPKATQEPLGIRGHGDRAESDVYVPHEDDLAMRTPIPVGSNSFVSA